MQRRYFLLLSSLVGISPYVEAKTPNAFEKEFIKVKTIIQAVQEHMFPQGSQIPSAQEMHPINFLFDTITHPSYDKDIRAFVIEGAKELMEREKGMFVSMSTVQKEEVLREFEKTSYGSNWLSRIMTLSIEGMFSAPVYGCNIKKVSWKSLKAYGGQPLPTVKYIVS